MFVDRSKALGAFLAKQLHQETNQPIIVVIDRSIESLIAMMGVVYSGNFYVPVDPDLPEARILSIIEVVQPKTILIPFNEVPPALDILLQGRAIFTQQNFTQDPDNDALLNEIRKKSSSLNPLYTIFTSGSTGIPKGVVINHRAVLEFIEIFSNTFHLSEQTIFGNLAPFDFDVSVKDIYSTFYNAASAVIIPKRLISIPANFIAFINEHKINTAIWATSALRIIENFKTLDEFKPQFITRVMFSGEVMPNKVLNYWRHHLPLANYVNLYGPTEITCNCAYFEVDRPFKDDEPLPIGKPFSNTELLLITETNNEAMSGETGEICVRSPSIALGYYNSPQSTDQAFCQNPLNPRFTDPIYRTGDLGRINERGELEFLSRKDFQIKHMGHRIELGEIELRVNALPFIEAGVCMYDQDREQIILFYQASEPANKQIYINLKDHLPKYSIPTIMLHFDKLPINKNGKIDRQLLMTNLSR
jgi:amino acid adenylation domain-containing protein